MLFVLLLFIRISLICSKIYSGSHAYLVILFQQHKHTLTSYTKAHLTTQQMYDGYKEERSGMKTKPHNHWIVCVVAVCVYVRPSLCPMGFVWYVCYTSLLLVPIHSFISILQCISQWCLLTTNLCMRHIHTGDTIRTIRNKQIKPLYSISNWIDDIDK